MSKSKKAYLCLSLAFILVAFALYFVNRTWANGLLIGHLFYTIYLLVLIKNVEFILGLGHYNNFLGRVAYLLRLAILAFPMLLGALRPEVFNIFAAFISLFINRVALMLWGYLGKDL